MSFDTCSIFLTYLQSYTSGYSCSYSTWIASYQIDLAAVRKNDCTQPYCRSFLTTLSTVGAYSDYGSCYLKDRSTSKNVSLQSLMTVCDGITVAPTPASGGSVFTPTANPYVYPSLYPDVSSGISTIAIVGIVAGVVVVLLFIGVLIVKNRKRNIPPPTTTTTAYVVLNEPTEPAPTATATAATSSSAGNSTGMSKPSNAEPRYGGSNGGHTVGSTQDLNSGASSRATTSNSSLFMSKSTPGQLDLCDLDMHKVHPKDVHLVKPLAQGAYGEVWLGEHLGSSIAVKRLLPSKTSLADLQKFIWEIKLLSKYDHNVCMRAMD
ncbi:hypothetical protein DYB32_008698 [Aphanomyces invadans]|uniref:Protein kinase domain-containing protein n=1 Tax=Aphanomyces invadans TaxID=157072 RepID=A0A3R6WGB7_9STRA|nr:hypothetical protein DYB32_008698 [Aphanomyces invadans]